MVNYLSMNILFLIHSCFSSILKCHGTKNAADLNRKGPIFNTVFHTLHDLFFLSTGITYIGSLKNWGSNCLLFVMATEKSCCFFLKTFCMFGASFSDICNWPFILKRS